MAYKAMNYDDVNCLDTYTFNALVTSANGVSDTLDADNDLRTSGPTPAGSRDTKSWPRISRHLPAALPARPDPQRPLARLPSACASTPERSPSLYHPNLSSASRCSQPQAA